MINGSTIQLTVLEAIQSVKEIFWWQFHRSTGQVLGFLDTIIRNQKHQLYLRFVKTCYSAHSLLLSPDWGLEVGLDKWRLGRGSLVWVEPNAWVQWWICPKQTEKRWNFTSRARRRNKGSIGDLWYEAGGHVSDRQYQLSNLRIDLEKKRLKQYVMKYPIVTLKK